MPVVFEEFHVSGGVRAGGDWHCLVVGFIYALEDYEHEEEMGEVFDGEGGFRSRRWCRFLG